MARDSSTLAPAGKLGLVRGIGLVNSTADLEKTVLAETNGTPIYLRDVATIQIGGDFRRAAPCSKSSNEPVSIHSGDLGKNQANGDPFLLAPGNNCR